MGKLTSDIRLAWRMIRAGLLTSLRIRAARRKIMFYALAGTILTVYLGFALLDEFLSKHPFIFAIYWLYCAVLVVFMLILAVYDMAAVKREMHIRAKQELNEVLKEIKETAGDEHQLTKQVEEDRGVAEGKK
ncbi:MAG: hypothetical protein MK183_13510 [Verrucomicrobiales bacterium]|nr:hypothetical protein [Verrucomicrobiales bacterium]